MSRASADPCWEHSQPRPTSVLAGSSWWITLKLWFQFLLYREPKEAVPPTPDFSFSIASDRDGTQGSLMLDWVAVRTGEHTE